MNNAKLLFVVSVVCAGCGSGEEPSFRPDPQQTAVVAPVGGSAGALQLGGPGTETELQVGATGTEDEIPPSPPTEVIAAPEDSAQRAPENFSVELTTIKGRIVIDLHRAWAPRGVDRFHELVRGGFFSDIAFFRVIPGFMAQFGIHGSPQVAAQWEGRRIADDPNAQQSNTRGRVSFATAGPNTRTTQLFINFGANAQLDGMGFTPIGQVRDMATVDRIFSGYGEGAPGGMGPAQGRITAEGNTYLRRDFPNLDYIRSARVLRSR